MEAYAHFMGTSKARMPVRVIRAIYMETYHMDYWTWRIQPWFSVIENLEVLEAKAHAERVKHQKEVRRQQRERRRSRGNNQPKRS